MAAERRVLGNVARHVGTTRGVFELGGGRRVEVDGSIEFDSPDAPKVGEKALVVVDRRGREVRWEPYAGTRLRPR